MIRAAAAGPAGRYRADDRRCVRGPAGGRPRGGDEAAFAGLFREVPPALLRHLRLIAPGAAGDVAGERWPDVVTGLAGFSGGEEAFRGWLFTIARHRAIDGGRSRARRPAVPLAHSDAAEQPAAPDTADLALARISARAALALISALPADQAEIIVLRVVAGLGTHDVVARIAGQSPGTVPGGRAARSSTARRDC